MFSTRSSMSQLKPETIVQYVQEAEEIQWAGCDLVGPRTQSNSSEPDDLGTTLLSHSSSLKKIHNYFSQLESRKCCLHLACRRSTFNAMRPVLPSKAQDDGSAKNKQQVTEVPFLENKDLRAFKHAYLCAVYPVLAAPEPPSPISPSPVLQDSASGKRRRSSHASNSGSTAGLIRSSSSPYSLHDSGVEESDEAALIPMESICEQLQRAFRLTRGAFRQYEAMIVKTYAKKSSQKLLAEELSGQLAVLETNNHPFYSPQNFITQNGYDLWQKQERAHISELLTKFWHTSLPFPRDSQDLIAELYSVHEDYRILFWKLMSYESQFREDSVDAARLDSFTPLSSASCRLLLEFGLRYGIGELYRKILYLEYLVNDFAPSVGYLSFVNNLLDGICQMLPVNKSGVVMVKKEFDLLVICLKSLKAQVCKAISQMKHLFPNNKPAHGIETLLSLLHSVISLLEYLSPAVQDTFEKCLTSTVQGIFRPTYEMFKTMAVEDMEEGRDMTPDPRLLNVLIQDVREDVWDYKLHFEGTFQKYFSISRMAASTFYVMLMEDVRTLTEDDILCTPMIEINLRMLALVYRLNQLDMDWKIYINPHEQSWRVALLPSLTQWTTALRSHMQNFVLNAISEDAFKGEDVNLPQPVTNYQTASVSSDHCSRSVSAMSLTPSVNSAFSTIVSSFNSTPKQNFTLHNEEESRELCQQAIPESQQENSARSSPESFSVNCQERLCIRPKAQFDTTSLNIKDYHKEPKVLYFSAYRRFSLPDRMEKQATGDDETVETKAGLNFQPVRERSSAFAEHSTYPLVDTNEPQCGHSGGKNKPIRDSSYRDECSVEEEQQTSSESAFHFPPLKIVSQERPVDSDRLVNFSKAVFTSETSIPQEHGTEQITIRKRHHPLRKDDEHVTSFHDSTAGRMGSDPSSSDDNEFMCSIDSNISFPSPPKMLQVLLPISGSAIDLLVILQRLCSFCQTLITVMLSETAVIPEGSQGHLFLSSSGSFSWKNQARIRKNATAHVEKWSESNASNAIDFSENPPSPSSTSSQCSTPGERNEGIGRKGSRQEETRSPVHTVHSAVDSGIASESLPQFDGYKFRLSLHLKILKSMCNSLVVYTGNMLCMDLCGTPRLVAKRLLGQRLVEFTESQQMGGLVWGCRHQTAETSHDCLYYYRRRTKYLCDRYEPVTQHMCTRINNVMACLQFLDSYQRKLERMSGIESKMQTLAPNTQAENGGEMEASAQRSSASSVTSEFVHISYTEDRDDPFRGASRASSLTILNSSRAHQRWLLQSKQYVEQTRQHIMSIFIAMCRLLAYKLNMFIRDGLPILLKLKSLQISIEKCLEPITSFLQKYLDSLSSWLYHDGFRRVLDFLWVFLVQDIETQANNLKKEGGGATVLAHNWMMTISHLIKFMNNNGHGIKKDLLLSQADDVICLLQLYTLSTPHLITLYLSLKEYSSEVDHLTLEENRLSSPPAILYRIHHELQSLHKSFSGAELIHWIVKNKDVLPPDILLPSGPVDRAKALTIAQILLDQQFIVDIDSESYSRSESPDMDCNLDNSFSPYPQLSVHSHGVFDSAMKNSFLLEQASNGSPTPANSPVSSRANEMSETQLYWSSDGSTASRTPTPRVAVADVHGDVSESDHEAAALHRGFHEYSASDNDDEIIAVSHNPLKLNMPQCPTVSDFRTSALQSVVDGKQRTVSDSMSEGSFIFGRRSTPFSSLADMTGGRHLQFVASSKKFYLIQQSSLHPGLGSQGYVQPSPNPELSHGEQSVQRTKLSEESLALVEKCYTHKISPLMLLTIIAGRRKSDPRAKAFFRRLPSSVQDRIRNILDEPAMECTSS